jgi:DNA-binding response OmpR family regulator
MKKHLLLVEDDAHIRMGLNDALSAENYEVTECGDGSQAIPLVKQLKPHAIILDVMLPGKSGFDICRDLRSQGDKTPILMLTAKGQEVDKVVGLELGADDYVTKPFGVRELVARVHALLRRADTSVVEDVPIPGEIAFGNVKLQTSTLRGVCGKEAFELTPRELKVLALLYCKAGQAVSRNEILDRVWGIDYYGTTRTLDQVIVKLRQKIDPGSEPKHLLTVHGLGYRLDV